MSENRYGHSHSTRSAADRSNELNRIKRDQERCEAVWESLAGLVKYCDSHNMDANQKGCTVIFLESIAEQLAHDKTTVGGTTYDLIQGHHWINQMVSRQLLEQMEALELIRPPAIFDRWSRVEKSQIARRVLWELGDSAKEYLDMSYLRGYSVADQYAGPHAKTADPRDMRGDPNESVVHRYFVRAGELYYQCVKGYSDVRTYVKLGNITDVGDKKANRRLDLVAYENGRIAATAEAELLPVDHDHVQRDAESMALVPGDSDWFVYAKPQVNDLLDTMAGSLLPLPSGHPGWDKRQTARSEAVDRLERVRQHPDETIPSLASEIVTDVNTIDNLRGLIKSHAPHVFRASSVDSSDIVWVGEG